MIFGQVGSQIYLDLGLIFSIEDDYLVYTLMLIKDYNIRSLSFFSEIMLNLCGKENDNENIKEDLILKL